MAWPLVDETTGALIGDFEARGNLTEPVLPALGVPGSVRCWPYSLATPTVRGALRAANGCWAAA